MLENSDLVDTFNHIHTFFLGHKNAARTSVSFAIFSFHISAVEKWNIKPNEAECLMKTLIKLCGEQAIIRVTASAIELTVDGKEAKIELDTMHISCTDQLLHHLISSVCQKMMNSLLPVCTATGAK